MTSSRSLKTDAEVPGKEVVFEEIGDTKYRAKTQS